jgi:TRAP-type C4-dicarboxylate transport system substrate-binding protein
MVANHGVTINQVDKAPFIAAAERAYEELDFKDARDRLWSEIGKR